MVEVDSDKNIEESRVTSETNASIRICMFFNQKYSEWNPVDRDLTHKC